MIYDFIWAQICKILSLLFFKILPKFMFKTLPRVCKSTYRKYKEKKEERVLTGTHTVHSTDKEMIPDNTANQTIDIKPLLDAFTTDVPNLSGHSEAAYQAELGRYLKEKLPNSTITYEEKKDGARPDITIDKNIAIEVKALKNPNTEQNRKYNSLHVDSIFKKIHTYDSWNQLIIVIFNSEYVSNRNWRDYEKMKEVVQMKEVVKKQNTVLFEK